jgi:TolB protein
MHRFFAVPALVAVLLAPAALAAQDPQPQGVRLGLRYQAEYQPGFVVLPFGGAGADAVRAIVRQDLDYSDRFEMKEADAGVRAGEPVNTRLWKERGADYVLEGELTGSGGSSALRLVLHDAVYGQKKGEHTFSLPPAGSPGFRMAVHAAADEVVRWATGDPGAAATRIAFVQQGRGAKEIYLVDFDGENVQRVTGDGSISLSPAWSPDGARLAFTSYRSGAPLLYERDLASGRDRLLSDRQGINITPAYAPDGRSLAFASTVAGATEVVLSDLARGGVQQLTQGRRFDSLSPSFSPDGRRVAFVSNRLGEPHIYVMQLGGEPRLVSEYVYGGRGYNVSPDWSPRGDFIAYHSRISGQMQLMMVGASGGTPRLLTNAGTNEDPSWAPDGRHVVFSSPDRDGGGLFVLDTVSGRVRPLLRGRGYGLPAWSPRLARATS